MSLFDGQWLPPETFELDVERLRRGWYTDQYFNNIVRILTHLAEEGYRFAGACPSLQERGVDVGSVAVGDLEVDMQFFTRREPFTILAGMDHALAILQTGAGYWEQGGGEGKAGSAGDREGRFVSTADRLEVEALRDGARVEPWETVLRVRGRYRDFAALETVMLGALARGSRIATNVYRTLRAARGKPILFFPARFDLPAVQSSDGYAYHIAVQRYNEETGANVPSLVSTDAQGAWWGGRGVGTVAHAYILSFLRDTATAMLEFARIMPVEVKRIALVDTNNDCIGDSLAAARALFARYRALKRAGAEEEAKKYLLFGVRPDTAANLRDVSLDPLGVPELDCGVNPRLVWALRRALDEEPARLNLPAEERAEAEWYFRNVKIIVSGGFNVERIERFETLGLPVDMYGVGSTYFSGEPNDFTADVVRVKIDGVWHDLAKVGRRAQDNPALERVEWGFPKEEKHR